MARPCPFIHSSLATYILQLRISKKRDFINLSAELALQQLMKSLQLFGL